ncbi:MAG: DegT/DnrJ/EryC1/StrS family aminotransferase [Bacteroidia bacterium]|nr:DegT/DnrJ/EryC1/StrS family aminotransferase [Bacteroidia bacterium]
MKKIQMVDLVSQHDKIRKELDHAIAQVIDSAAFINGPDVKAFADELANYTGAKFVIPCANGTDALQIAMMALGLKPGDEVIVPTFTYVATAEVIALLGLTPVLIDVNPQTFCAEPGLIEKAITTRTKAIVPVHLFGQCADMEQILALAKKHNLYVIEDTAQAIGAEYTFADGTRKQAGTMGTIGTTSFFPSKNLGCMGDGGAIFTNDETLAKKIKMIANHGQSVQYIHDEVGVNSRLDTIQAAILRVKLKQLDSYKTARQQAAAYYDRYFLNHPHLHTPVRNPHSTHVFHQYTLKATGIDRKALREFLASKGVPSMVYYPYPLHMQKAYANDRYKAGHFPVSELLCEQVISLPISTEMDEKQLEFICRSVTEFCSAQTKNVN